MRIGGKQALAMGAGVLCTGLLVAWLGLIGVRASSGHWGITDWFLHWVMRSSVRTASLGTEVPPLDDPNLLPLAAGHYEIGCASCHGSPASPRPASVLGMLPPPPDLRDKVGEWTDAELFEIVRHGIRFSGMPAWPAVERDDEVWALVAFLRRYPGMDARTYSSLAGVANGRPVGADAALRMCEGCHADDRLGRRSLVPRLSGQAPDYLRDSLKAYLDGRRPSGVMQTAASILDAETIGALARHYATAPFKTYGRPPGPVPVLVAQGDPSRRIPACSSCHDRGDANPSFPRLAGQSRGYLEAQLRLFVAGTRGGGPYSELMHKAVRELRPEEIKPLAEYYGR